MRCTVINEGDIESHLTDIPYVLSFHFHEKEFKNWQELVIYLNKHYQLDLKEETHAVLKSSSNEDETDSGIPEEIDVKKAHYEAQVKRVPTQSQYYRGATEVAYYLIIVTL